MYVYIINFLYKLLYYQTSTCAESCGCNTNAAHTPYCYIICILYRTSMTCIFCNMYMATHCKLQKYLQISYRLALPSCTTLRFLLPVKHQQLSLEGRIEARVYDMKGKRHQRFALHVENNIQIIPQNQNATCTQICVKFYNFIQYRHQPKLTRYLYRFCWCYICGHLVSNLLESLSNLCFFFTFCLSAFVCT